MKQKMLWRIGILLLTILMSITQTKGFAKFIDTGATAKPAKTTTITFLLKDKIRDTIQIYIMKEKDGYAFETPVYSIILEPNKAKTLELSSIEGVAWFQVTSNDRRNNLFGNSVSYFLSEGDRLNFEVTKVDRGLIAMVSGEAKSLLSFYQQIVVGLNPIPVDLTKRLNDPDRSIRRAAVFHVVKLLLDQRKMLIEENKQFLKNAGGIKLYERMKTEIMTSFIKDSREEIQHLTRINIPLAKTLMIELDAAIMNYPVSDYTYMYVRQCSSLSKTKAKLSGEQSRLGQIIKDYKGSLRDKILVQYYTEEGNPDPTQNVKEISEALKLIENIGDKEFFKNAVVKRNKGVPFYPFELTNEDGKKIKLQDLKEKVLLIDFWFTGCTGCASLARDLHEKVIPKFKDKKEILFVSISVDKQAAQWKNSIKKKIYTSPESLNLYTDGLGEEHPLIKYYNFIGFPQLILVNKEGKILNFNARPDNITLYEGLNQQIQEAINAK